MPDDGDEWRRRGTAREGSRTTNEGGGTREVEQDGSDREKAKPARETKRRKGRVGSWYFEGVEGRWKRERERERWHWGIAPRRVGARGELAFLNLCPRMPLIILICNASNPLIAHRS